MGIWFALWPTDEGMEYEKKDGILSLWFTYGMAVIGNKKVGYW